MCLWADFGFCSSIVLTPTSRGLDKYLTHTLRCRILPNEASVCVTYLCHTLGLYYMLPHKSSNRVSLTNVDKEILALLRKGRATQSYIVDETGRSRQYVHNRLGILTAAGYLKNIHAKTALYELVGDPLADEENGG
ncbi:helix-turn-helix transcriptional regulator [Haladaptatus sp. AB618]|uniref:helix-turn-helix transcriptional regulator n=1 Tax=Haladaptatus sp. AB618 TaxID=2934173 RepID=UPI0034E97147